MAIQEKKRSRRQKTLQKRNRATVVPSFFRLPAELRNKIYELVLTAPNITRIICVPGTARRKQKPKLVDPQRPEFEFNQLKFVNRQLYKETAGLEVSGLVLECKRSMH